MGINSYIEWILGAKDTEIKRMTGVLKPEYQATLLWVVEQALPQMNHEHGESHPAFPTLRDTIEKLRRNVTVLLTT